MAFFFYSQINISLDFFAPGSTTSLTRLNTCSLRSAGTRKIRKNIQDEDVLIEVDIRKRREGHIMRRQKSKTEKREQ